tara:strand:+ start:474 stop:608 length:135 start_codon:yes stop_codon:yes gene_type:complete
MMYQKKTVEELRDELKKVRDLVKKYPNNMQLGKRVRAWALGDDL